jgi:hypothetical protein
MIDLFSKIQKWVLKHWFYLQEIFVKTSEVDQIRGLQTMYEVMIWVQDMD